MKDSSYDYDNYSYIHHGKGMNVKADILVRVCFFLNIYYFLVYENGGDRKKGCQSQSIHLTQFTISSLIHEVKSNEKLLEKSSKIRDLTVKDGDHELEQMSNTSFDSVIYSSKYHQLKPENQQHLKWWSGIP